MVLLRTLTENVKMCNCLCKVSVVFPHAALGLRNKKDMIAARDELYRAPQSENETLALASEADQISSSNWRADDKSLAVAEGMRRILHRRADVIGGFVLPQSI